MSEVHLENYLSEEFILPDIVAKHKWNLIEIMADTISRAPAVRDNPALTKEVVLNAILEREQQMSTGMGNGFAFPHARLEGLNTVAICLATLNEAIDYEALDGQKVHTACMVLAPSTRPTMALKVMAEISRLFSSRETELFLAETDDPKKIYAYIAAKQLVVDAPITAGEIMRPTLFSVNPSTPLRQVAAMMSKHQAHATAVVDAAGKLVGQITCDHLFNFGVPEFFRQLKSVSFIEEFDPFEKYFQDESGAVAGDLMTSNFAAVPVGTMMLEIVFLLTVKKHSKVYVVSDGTLVGEIDKTSVLDRVINI